eukprot:4389524-Alexandrium_andersonii.AAC.1
MPQKPAQKNAPSVLGVREVDLGDESRLLTMVQFLMDSGFCGLARTTARVHSATTVCCRAEHQ